LAEQLSDLPEVFSSADLVLGAGVPPSPLTDAAPIQIQEHWFPTGRNAGRIVLKLSGCDSIADAEALAGKQILMPADRLPALAPDTFFVGDLVGCTLLCGEQIIGTVDGVEFPTSPDGRTRLEDVAPLLSVLPQAKMAHTEDETILIPFVRAWLESVDIPGRRIVMHLPDGLIDSLSSSAEDTPQA
jgi:16S rRNA processing protein RimM